MKFFLSTLLLISIISCNSTQDVKTNAPTIEDEDIIEQVQPETLLELSQRVLIAIKENNMNDFSSFIHTDKGVRFSAYAYVDSKEDVVLNTSDFSPISQDNFLWGYYDGRGDSISLTIKNYFNEFVYDVDFINAEQIKQDTLIGSGNSLNNLKNVYTNAHFVEYHFSGFNPEYKGMDWKSLRLVFEEENGAYFLIGVIHDQWTI